MDHRNIIHYLLVLGLLLGQLAQVVHASDLLEHSDSESCETCLLASGHDHALPGDSSGAWQTPPADILPVPVISLATQASPIFYLSRAPPRLTLTR